MTVPVARASARRTVRVAAGLVAGQAVLCAVIGYVTLGGGPGSPVTNGAWMGGPLTAHPISMPTPAVPLTSPTTVVPDPPPRTGASTHARPAADSGSRQRSGVTPTPTPAEPPPDVLAGTSDPPTATSPTSPPASTAAAPEAPSSFTDSPPSPQATQLSVTIGDVCDPIDAPGVATDGRPVRCASDTDGLLHWRTLD